MLDLDKHSSFQRVSGGGEESFITLPADDEQQGRSEPPADDGADDARRVGEVAPVAQRLEQRPEQKRRSGANVIKR